MQSALCSRPSTLLPRILIADDHAIFAEMLRAYLEKTYAVIAVVADGRAMLQEDIRLRPDVVVADVSMSLWAGLDAATGGIREQAAARPKAKPTPERPAQRSPRPTAPPAATRPVPQPKPAPSRRTSAAKTDPSHSRPAPNPTPKSPSRAAATTTTHKNDLVVRWRRRLLMQLGLMNLSPTHA